jgi:hypothetical protein
MFGGTFNFATGLGHILLATGHNEDWLLAPNRCFDVGVRFGPECFDFAA